MIGEKAVRLDPPCEILGDCRKQTQRRGPQQQQAARYHVLMQLVGPDTWSGAVSVFTAPLKNGLESWCKPQILLEFHHHEIGAYVALAPGHE